MAGLDAVKSTSLTYLDSVPIANPLAAAGAGARIVEVDDYCAATAAGLQSSGSYYKLVRVPTGAFVKSVLMGADVSPNANGALALQMSWIFSDSVDDGTPTFYQGLIPTNANTGGTTTLAAPSSPNAIYGFWLPTQQATVIEPTEIVLNGIVGTHYSFTGGLTNLPLWQLFGFTDGRGNAADPGGYFDLLAYVATAATTGAACNIYAKVRYGI
jgi:hypothetical protein